MISIIIDNPTDEKRMVAELRQLGWVEVMQDTFNLKAPAKRLTFATIEAFRARGATVH